MTKTKSETKIFSYTHPTTGDVFTYEDKTHEYKLNGIELPGTTTPLKLVNELSWDKDGKMTDKSFIIQQWAIKLVANDVLDKFKDWKKNPHAYQTQSAITNDEECLIMENIVKEAKGAPNRSFTSAGVSGTEIHAKIESYIKDAIQNSKGYIFPATDEAPQVQNFIDWAVKNKVEFLFSEEPLYSKEWMSCGTVDFICRINGKVLIGDIKTNGNKRRYEWDARKNAYDFSKPVSDIHITGLWQTGCYGKMATEPGARQLLSRFDGVVVVNIKKSGEFDETLDTRYSYNTEALVKSFDHVINLYKLFRQQL